MIKDLSPSQDKVMMILWVPVNIKYHDWWWEFKLTGSNDDIKIPVNIEYVFKEYPDQGCDYKST